MRILGFGTYDTSRHPRVGVILDGLRAAGDEVIEANAPLGFTTAERVAMLGRPWLVYRLVGRVLVRWMSLVRLARQARRTGRFDGVVVGYLGHFDVVLARLLLPRDTIVLDLLIFAADTARDRGVPSGPRVRLLTLLDGLAMRCADVIVVDTVEHGDMVPIGQRAKAVVVPVGAGAAWFAAGRSRHEGSPIDPMRVVFFGLFTPLQGADVIGEALAELADCPGIVTTMIGSGQDSMSARDAATGNHHVKWVDWVNPDELPIVVAAHDVCLGIFGTTAKGQRVVPNKVYQGAAAGCAIVTSETGPQRRALGEAAVFVPAGDPAALAASLRNLESDRPRLARLGDAARERSLERFSASAIVAPLRESLSPGPSVGPSRGDNP